jgi:UDP-4-amino-4,6-dideoxy-N-acetyl-beta-L-altrosamine transaminase
MIPYGRQDISQADIDAVVGVLQSDFLTQGPMVPAFESKVAKYCEAKYAVAVNSATSALHIACLALDLGPGDYLWTSPLTFVASANCALYCGAEVDFVDIDPKTYNMSVSALSEKLQIAKRNGVLPKIVIPVHFAGQSCDMKAIHELAVQYGFKVIEDASHAIGGKYLGKSIGGCDYSNVTIFSFHPVKIVTTGEGGMAVTNDPELADRMFLLRSHGITRDASRMSRNAHGPWYYEQIELGYNYRMTDIQAALGISQIDRLDEFVEMRHKIASRYQLLLKHLLVSLPWQSADSYSSFHLYPVRIDSAAPKTRAEIFNALRDLGIGVNVHYIPVYSQPYYVAKGFKANNFPETENYYSQTITLPLYSQFTEDQQDTVVAALNKVLSWK